LDGKYPRSWDTKMGNVKEVLELPVISMYFYLKK